MPKPNLNNFGKKLKLSKRPDNKKVITEKELFLDVVNMLYGLWNRSNRVYDSYKVNLLEYEELFYQTIENCLLLKYSAWKTEIILWFVFAREDDNGEIMPLILHIGDKEEQIILETPTELWDLLKRIEKYETDENNNKSDKE